METVLHEASRDPYQESVTARYVDNERLPSLNTNEKDELHYSNTDTGVGFSLVPRGDPVDIAFEDVTYTASVGFRKGNFNARCA